MTNGMFLKIKIIIDNEEMIKAICWQYKEQRRYLIQVLLPQ